MFGDKVLQLFLLFLGLNLHPVCGVKHSLQYFYTGVTPGINFPEFTAVGLVDGQEFVYYDSNIRRMIPKTEWIQKNNANDPGYWDRQTQILQGNEEAYKVNVATLMQRFNQTGGVHTVQYMYGCELDDDGTKRGYSQFGYDGEDFISLDLNTLTYTAANQRAVITKLKLDATGAKANHQKNYLETECIEWLQMYVSYGRDTLERKVPPQALVFQKDSSSPLVCLATGIFPKEVMMYWQKDGEEVHEDVELTETVPNPDGTFQKRSILTVSPEELQKNKYSCVIEHSGVKKEIPLSDIRVLNGGGSDGGSGGGSDGVLIVIIIGAIETILLVLIGCLGFLIWKKTSVKRDFRRVLGLSSAPFPSPYLDVCYVFTTHGSASSMILPDTKYSGGQSKSDVSVRCNTSPTDFVKHPITEFTQSQRSPGLLKQLIQLRETNV